MRSSLHAVTWLVAPAVLAALAGCARRVGFGGSPVSNEAVDVRPTSVVAELGQTIVDLRITNRTADTFVCDRNQFALVGARTEYFRRGGNNVFEIAARRSRMVKIGFKEPGVAFHRAKGLFLRLDGIYANGKRVQVPPIKLGKPTHNPGTAVATFQAPSGPHRGATASDDPSPFRRFSQWLSAQVEGGSAGTTSGGAAAESGRRGTAVPGASRVRALNNPGIRCASLPLKAVQFNPELAGLLDDVLLGALEEAGFDAIGRDDINAMLGLESTKDALGCDEGECMAELGGALGVDYLVAGSLGKMGESYIVTIKLINVKHARVLARSNKMGNEGLNQLPQLITQVVDNLVGKSGL